MPVPGVRILPGAKTDDVSVLNLPVNPNVLPVDLAGLPKILANAPLHSIIPAVDSSRQVSSCLLRAESKNTDRTYCMFYIIRYLSDGGRQWELLSLKRNGNMFRQYHGLLDFVSVIESS